MPQSAVLPTYSTIYAFGDSLSDAGNLSISTAVAATTPVSPPYFGTQYGPLSGNVFSNGPVWVQNLSIALGLGALSPNVVGGTDFAYGGAQTGSTPQNANTPQYAPISLPAQLSLFQTQVPKPSANALYTLSIGANDLDAILADTTLTPDQQSTDVNDAVANEVAFISHLIGDGAKDLLVLNVPDLGKVPVITLGLNNGSNTPSLAYDALATQLTSQFNAALTTQLATLTGATIRVVDANALINSAVATPSAYSLTNVTDRVWNGDFTSASSGTLTSTSVAAQNQYLFFDAYHPTESGHQAIADLAEQALSGVAPLVVANMTSEQPVVANGTPYTGPVKTLQQQYISITPDNLNITASTPNWFIQSGSGEDAIAVTSGINVLDGGAGSNFLSGGSGTDTFFLNDFNSPATTWSTVVGFHATDNVTLRGVSQSDFALSWSDGAGAAGSTGLTLTATAAARPETLLTLAGLTQASLTNGQLAVSFGTDTASGLAYMNIHANT